MKKKIIIAVLILAIALSVAFAFTVGAGADAAEPSLTIGGKSLVLGNSIYIRYMVAAEGVEDINEVSLLVWNEAQETYVKGTEKYEVKWVEGTTVNNDVTYYHFDFEDVAAKRLADDFYAVAYTKVGDKEYYSAPNKYSVLKYAYNMMGKLDKEASTTEGLIPMLEAMLEYGAKAQYYFGNYRTDRLANADFYQIKTVGGKLPDGFTDGLYLTGDKVTITADAPAEGYKFVGWKNNANNIVSTDATTTVEVEYYNDVYTAVYEEDIPDLTAIVGKWSGSENAYVVTNNYEFVIEADKIASAKYGTTVMNVTSVKFDGTTLTVNYTIDGVDAVKTMTFTYADGKLVCDAAAAGSALALEKMVTVSIDYGTSTQADKTVEVAYGNSYKLAKPSTFTGYNFIGWYINDVFVSATAAYTIPSVTEDTTAVAAWEIKTYNVKFYDQDYTVIKTLVVEYGGYISADDVPAAEEIVTKEGYTFSGNWATSKTSTTAVDIFAAIKNAKNYYPIMIDPQVPVSNLAGTWTGTETEDNSMPSLGVVNVITRDYTFVIDEEGNITVPTLVVTVDNGNGNITDPTTYTDAVVTDVTFNGDTLKLTVKYDGDFTKKTYSFTYDAEAGTLTKSTSFVLAKGTVEPEEPEEEPAPDLTAIVGKWIGTESLVSVEYEIVIEADKIVSAKYGTTVMNVTSVKFDGTTLTVNYTIEGAEDVRTIVFTYANDNLSTDSAAATGSLTLSKKVTVTLNYGEKGGSDKVTVYDYGKSLSKPSASWTGYNLVGWTLNGELVESFPITVTEDITLVAQWEVKVFDVIFWNQDYTVAIKTVKVKYGEYVAAEDIPNDPAAIVTVEGYEFAGTWRTSKTSSTVTDPLTKKITAKTNFYPNMIEPQVPVSNLAGTWTGTETVDNSYYDFIDIRTREYTIVIDAEGNITAVCVETIDDGEELTGPTTYAGEDIAVSDVTFNGDTLTISITWNTVAKKYTFTYDAEAGTLTKGKFVLTKAAE